MVQWIRITCQRRGNGFNPRSKKILRAVEQLSLCVTTTEPRAATPEPECCDCWKPTCLEPVLYKENYAMRSWGTAIKSSSYSRS